MKAEAASSASVNFWEISERVRTSQWADPGFLHKWEALVGSVFIFYILLSETSSAGTGIRLMHAKQTPLIYWQSLCSNDFLLSVTPLCVYRYRSFQKYLYLLHFFFTSQSRHNTNKHKMRSWRKWSVFFCFFFTNKNLKCAACTLITPNSDIVQMSRQTGQGQH